jgi:hypothetical protein
MLVNLEDQKIPEVVKLLTTSLSAHIQHAQKIWAFAAALTVIVVAGKSSGENLTLFGFPFAVQSFFQATTFVIAIVSVAHSAAELQMQRCKVILLECLKYCRSEITPKYSTLDVTMALPINNYQRIAVINFYLPKLAQGPFYFIYKVITDFLYFGLPSFGAIISLSKSGMAPCWLDNLLQSLGGSSSSPSHFQLSRLLSCALHYGPSEPGTLVSFAATVLVIGAFGTFVVVFWFMCLPWIFASARKLFSPWKKFPRRLRRQK